MNKLPWQLRCPRTEQKSQQSLIFSSWALRPYFAVSCRNFAKKKKRLLAVYWKNKTGLCWLCWAFCQCFSFVLLFTSTYDTIYHTNIWFCFEPLKIIKCKNSTFQILVGKAFYDKVLRKYLLSLYRAIVLPGSLLLSLLPFNLIYQRNVVFVQQINLRLRSISLLSYFHELYQRVLKRFGNHSGTLELNSFPKIVCK